ncbi:MAG: hypothetical protein V3S64_14900 [bacterium]
MGAPIPRLPGEEESWQAVKQRAAEKKIADRKGQTDSYASTGRSGFAEGTVLYRSDETLVLENLSYGAPGEAFPTRNVEILHWSENGWGGAYNAPPAAAPEAHDPLAEIKRVLAEHIVDQWKASLADGGEGARGDIVTMDRGFLALTFERPSVGGSVQRHSAFYKWGFNNWSPFSGEFTEPVDAESIVVLRANAATLLRAYAEEHRGAFISWLEPGRIMLSLVVGSPIGEGREESSQLFLREGMTWSPTGTPIPGRPKRAMDLNGDGHAEFLFSFDYQGIDHAESDETLYLWDNAQKTFLKTPIAASSLNDANGPGHSEILHFDPSFQPFPLITVQRESEIWQKPGSKEDDGENANDEPRIETSTRRYQWDAAQKAFVALED